MGVVGNLYALFGLRINEASFAQGDKLIQGAKKAMDDLDGAFRDRQGRWRAANGRFLTMTEKAKLAAAGVKGVGDELDKAGKKGKSSFDGINTALRVMGGYLAGRVAYGALITFNSTVEDSKNQIAGMLALAKKTDLKDQLTTANTLMANLTRRAATLPGTTAEYVRMLSMITQPIVDAGLGTKQLEDITVSAVVAAKALGVEADVAARDIDQATRGMFRSVDVLTGKILGTMGFKGEEGRARFNAMSQKKRAETLFQALDQKQIKQLAEAQGKTFSGVLSTLQDALQQFFGKVGKPLFEGLTKAIREMNKWLGENEAKVKETAAAIGGALVLAFEVLRSTIAGVVTVIRFLIEHSELGKSVLIAFGIVALAFGVKMMTAWLMALGPIALVIAAVAAVVLGVRKLIAHWDDVKRAVGKVLSWMSNQVARVGDGVRAVGDTIRDAAARVAEFFTRDIPSAIKAAFNALADLPVIKQLVDLVNALRSASAAPADTSTGVLDAFGRAINPRAVAPAGRSASVSVNGVSISVTSNNADPAAVGDTVLAAFDRRLADKLRETMDTVA